MKFILGTKQEMSQVFDESGKVVPVTIIKAGPAIVTQVKTKEKDGYAAVQIGFGARNPKNIKKPQLGHLKRLPTTDYRLPTNIRHLKEFRLKDNHQPLTINYQLGDIIDVSIFKEGDKVAVSGISKGKGFQGVVKRHGFHGGPRTHGQKHSEREPGSIGATWPQRVLRGKRMPGRMGGERRTIKNLKIVKVDPEDNLLAVSGAIPGRAGALLEIRA